MRRRYNPDDATQIHSGKDRGTGIIVDQNAYHREYRRRQWAGMTPEQHEEEKLRRREYYAANKERFKAASLAWCGSNRNSVRDYQKRYVSARAATDPQFRIRTYLQIKLSKGVRHIANGYYPEMKKPFIGCSWLELKAHFERLFTGDMSWSNYGSVWEVVHITPRSAFDLTDPEQQLKCFHYSNLRPLVCQENCSRGARLTGAEVIKAS